MAFGSIKLLEYLENELLPLVEIYPDKRILDGIEEWKEEIGWAKKRFERSEKQYGNAGINKKTAGNYESGATYIYCDVILPFSTRSYSYRTEDASIKVGDKVLAPVGKEMEEMTGTVVAVGKYAGNEVPYPVEKTKTIIQKVNI